MASQEYFRFLDLPFDVSIMILRYLLPDQHFILHEAYKTDVDRFYSQDRIVGDCLKHPPTWSTFDYKSCSPYPDILLTNHQVYLEGFYYLYTLKTFKLVIDRSGHNFLSLADCSGADLPPLPYSSMKEFILEIQGHSMRTTACDLRKELIGLLRRFHNHNVHFKKMRLRFPEPLGPLPGWDFAWDSAEPKSWDCKPEVEVDDDFNETTHSELTARDSGAPSTFAWLVCAFATCPSLADECVIDLPESLKDKPHMQACAKQYAEGLDGRSPFDPEKECCLKQDLYVLKHQYGYREDCDCEICDKRRRSVWLFAVREKLKGYHLWWKQFRSMMEEYPWRCWWIDWTLDHRFWPNGCKCEECETALNEELQRRALYLEEQDYSLDQMMAYQQLERCKRPDHIRKKLKSGPSPRMSWSVVEECEDCEESKEEEQCDWCNDRHPISTKPKNKSKNVWWRDLCDYPMDFWMSWERELHPHIDYGHHSSEICHSVFCGSCVWENTRGLLDKEASRLSVLARLGLIGKMVWQSIWTRKKEPAESEED